jgi:hypothetical protein
MPIPDGLDPVLGDAARKLAEGRTAYEQDHPGLSMPRKVEEAWMRAQTGGKYGVGDADTLFKQFATGNNAANILRSASQGATLGFADELAGIGNPAETSRVRLANTLYGQANPGPAFLANVGGGLAIPGLGLLSTLAKGMSVPAKIALGAGVGSGVAATNIAGNAEGDLASRAQAVVAHPGQLAMGAAIGGGIPALQGAAAQVGPRVGALDPTQRATNQMAGTYLPAAGGPETVQAYLAKFGTPAVSTVDPMLAETSPELASAYRTDVARNPALRPAMKATIAAQEAGTVPDAATGILQKRDSWAAPLYDKMREAYQSLRLATRRSLTIGEALSMPKDSPEYRAAMRAAANHPGLSAYAAVPGFEKAAAPGIGDVLDQPEVQSAFNKALEADGQTVLPVGQKAYTFQQIRDAIRFLGQRADAAFKADNATLGLRLRRAASSLDANLADQVPEYAPTQAKFAAWSKLAENAAAEGGALALPKAPNANPVSMAMSPFMSAQWWATKPVVGSMVKKAMENTAAAQADMLRTRGTQNIQDVLDEIASRRPGQPQTLPVRDIATLARVSQAQ